MSLFVIVIIITTQALDTIWWFWDLSSTQQNCSTAFQETFILEQQIFCVYSGVACGLQTLGVRNPSLQTGAGGAGPELGEDVWVSHHLWEILQWLFKRGSLPAACSAPLPEVVAVPQLAKGSLLPWYSVPEFKSPILDFAWDTSVCGPFASPATGGADR